MTRYEHLLTTAQEEASELAQRVSKALRFGIDQVQPASHAEPGTTDVSANPERLSNRERIRNEFYHLVATLDMLNILEIKVSPGFTGPYVRVPAHKIQQKQDKIEHYLDESRTLGTLV